MEEITNKYAVVTGVNKGIGFEICKQLASKGITVVLTARDEKKGLEAVEKLKQSGYDKLIFHQLDVADPASVDSLANFIKCQIGKIDILVNNAGIGGFSLDDDVVKNGVPTNWIKLVTQTNELVEKCIETNYYGAKRMCDALIPLLQLSNAPRIVNVSSSAGKLMNVPYEWAKNVLSDTENITEERVDEVMSQYLNKFKEGSLEIKGGGFSSVSAYVLSKAAMNAYTRTLAKKYPNFCINCVCPGYVKTDINYNTGVLTVEKGAEGPVLLALLPNGGPSGQFFFQKEETSFN